jgi:hypothetical protein
VQAGEIYLGCHIHVNTLGKEKNPWLLGKMFENRFPDASGRELREEG